MLPFRVVLRLGEPVHRQVVFAAKRAVVAGELRPGSAFPSVRELSQALKINPNTAHKAVSELVRLGILEVRPGIGTVVARRGHASTEERRALLSGQIEQLVVEAKRLGLRRRDLQSAIAAQWTGLAGHPSSRAGRRRAPPPRKELQHGGD